MMKEPEILGTGGGLDASGGASLVIFVDKNAKTAGTVLAALPENLGGVPVVAQLTEKFRAFPGKGHGHGGGGSPAGNPPTAQKKPPNQIGNPRGAGSYPATQFFSGGTPRSLA